MSFGAVALHPAGLVRTTELLTEGPMSAPKAPITANSCGSDADHISPESAHQIAANGSGCLVTQYHFDLSTMVNHI